MISDQLFFSHLNALAGTVNNYLDQVLCEKQQSHELARPPRLVAAMRHGVLNGGKRLRPFLLIQTAQLFGVTEKDALHAACALECLHSYSLIHDDLPAMDDDDLRRGRPTVHIAFDEPTAILAGDALLTFAFDMLSEEACHKNPVVRVALIQLLARASGMGGMIGGQMLDIAAETAQVNEQEIRLLQAMKTGALIRYACDAGALLGDANTKQKKALFDYGEAIGLGFQLADDLLDITSNAETMGKATGKDAVQGKGTLVSVLGEEKTRALLHQTIEQAQDHLSTFGDKADMLRKTARFIAERKN